MATASHLTDQACGNLNPALCRLVTCGAPKANRDSQRQQLEKPAVHSLVKGKLLESKLVRDLVLKYSGFGPHILPIRTYLSSLHISRWAMLSPFVWHKNFRYTLRYMRSRSYFKFGALV